ncbi:hypothetical protein T10_5554, partial [Trichinella papuae]
LLSKQTTDGVLQHQNRRRLEKSLSNITIFIRNSNQRNTALQKKYLQMMGSQETNFMLM